MMSVRPFAAPAVQARRSTRLRVVSEYSEGTKVRVNKSIVVFHAPKRKEGLDLKDMEGTIVKDVRQYNGEVLSANMPYKTEFLLSKDPEDKKAKVLVHLADGEFDVIES